MVKCYTFTPQKTTKNRLNPHLTEIFLEFYSKNQEFPHLTEVFEGQI